MYGIYCKYYYPWLILKIWAPENEEKKSIKNITSLKTALVTTLVGENICTSAKREILCPYRTRYSKFCWSSIASGIIEAESWLVKHFFHSKNNNVRTNVNNSVGKHVMIVLIDVMLRISVLKQADRVSLFYAVQVNIWWHFRNGRYNFTTDVIALTFA